MSTTPTVTALSSLPNQGNSNGQYFSFSENANNNGYFPGNYNGNGPAFTQNDFEASYTGKITISASGGGTYTFGLNSDDGSMVFIDGNAVVNDNNYQGQNGSNPATQATGSVYLAPGPHDITILYYQGTGGYGLNASYNGPDSGNVAVNLPNAVLSPSSMTVGSLDGSGSVQLQSGVNLIAGGDNTSSTFGGVISGIGALTKTGTGMMVLTNASTFAGNTVVSAGTLQLGDGAANNGSVAGNVFNQSVLAFANPAAQTFGGTIFGSGMVTKSAAGALVLPVGNPYTGGTQISAGQVTLNNAYGLGNGPITLGGGTVLRVQPNGVGGFGGNGTAGAGWTLNRNDNSGNPPFISNNVLTLTDNNGSEARSAFLNSPVNASGNFTATFVYQTPTVNNSTNTGAGSTADGVTFLLQNTGPTAVGGSGGSLGGSGINNDVGVTFNIYPGHTIGIGAISGGADPAPPAIPSIRSTSSTTTIRSW